MSKLYIPYCHEQRVTDTFDDLDESVNLSISLVCAIKALRTLVDDYEIQFMLDNFSNVQGYCHSLEDIVLYCTIDYEAMCKEIGCDVHSYIKAYNKFMSEYKRGCFNYLLEELPEGRNFNKEGISVA